MRKPFIEALLAVAHKDSRVVFLTADLGYTVVEPFEREFPERFFNVGVSEQNMIGLATGLANGGFIPFAYSISTFLCLRAFEFIRNGPVHHQLPVRLVGIGLGLDYNHNGFTHYALEDIGVLRTQPGLTIISPADDQQTKEALLSTYDLPGPIYYRLSKRAHSPIAGLPRPFSMECWPMVREGSDLLFISTAGMVDETLRAAKVLDDSGIHASVMIATVLAPLPIQYLVDVLSRHRLVVSVESHYRTGGIGTAVSEIIAEQGISCRVIRCGISTVSSGLSGSLSFLYEKQCLSSNALVDTALRGLKDC